MPNVSHPRSVSHHCCQTPLLRLQMSHVLPPPVLLLVLPLPVLSLPLPLPFALLLVCHASVAFTEAKAGIVNQQACPSNRLLSPPLRAESSESAFVATSIATAAALRLPPVV